MENEINNPIKKIFEKTVNEITEPEVEEQNFYLDQFKINPCDIVKETEDIIKNKYSIHNHGMYSKDFFKGQKLLIVMLYTYGMIEGENEGLSDKYIMESKIYETECIQSSIDYTGIECKVVTNYKDAINELTKSYKKDYCEYYSCIIMSGRPYNELPNPNDDPYLLGQFIKVVNQFWKNGGGIAHFADNAPFNYQTNLLIESLLLEIIQEGKL